MRDSKGECETDLPCACLLEKRENVLESVKYWGVCEFIFADLHECISGNVFILHYNIALYCTVVNLNRPKPAVVGGKDGVLTVSPAVGDLERLPSPRR